MKKNYLIGILSISILLLGPFLNVKAENSELPKQIAKEDVLFSSEDYKGVKALESEIEKDLDECTGHEVTLNEQDYKSAIKIYTNAGIVESGDPDENTITKIAGKATYVWYFSYEGKYAVTVARGLPLRDGAKKTLTKEEQKKVTENVGKWMITSYGTGENTSYIDTLKKNLPDIDSYDRVIFLGGEKGFDSPIALSLKNGKADKLVSLGYSYEAMGDKTVGSFVDVVKTASKIKYDDATSGGGQTTNTDKENKAEAGVDSNSYLVFVFLTFLAIGIVVYVRHYKATCKNGKTE